MRALTRDQKGTCKGDSVAGLSGQTEQENGEFLEDVLGGKNGMED